MTGMYRFTMLSVSFVCLCLVLDTKNLLIGPQKSLVAPKMIMPCLSKNMIQTCFNEIIIYIASLDSAQIVRYDPFHWRSRTF